MLWMVLALLLLIVVLLLPAGVVAGYKEQRWDVFLKLGPAEFRLYPDQKKRKKKESAGLAVTDKSSRKQKSVMQELKGFFPFLQILFDFLANFRKSVRINDLLIRIVLAGSDPYDVSIQYGYACAAVGNLLPCINNFLHIKKQKIDVSCDYLAEQTIIHGSLDLSMPMFLLLKLVIQYGLRILKHHYSLKTKEKVV